MKKLLYLLTSLSLLVGVFTGCEKPNKNGEEGGGTPTEKTGTIKGVVTDKGTGNPLSGVTIELQPTGKQVQTAEDGVYILENLKAGSYTLKAQKDGYVDYAKEGIQLVADQISQFDIELEGEDYTETAFGLRLEMVYVEGGTFEMGATVEQGDDAQDWEKPVRMVKLDGYHIGKYEVTQAQWEKVMGITFEEQKEIAGMENRDVVGEGSDYPMYYVKWEEAQAFCKKLSEATGMKYVLPTEAMWEYAARGGKKSQHYKYVGSNDVEEVAWYKDNSDEKAHSVGLKKANELGIYDMSGNLCEYCSDWYADRYDENDTDNPQGPDSGSFHVNRGGFWNSRAVYCRVSERYRGDGRVYSVGFRVAVLP
ncbi:MAG: SUMF1/EgtB/PvdO family nonheme iron enzyme [Bacteroidales bacterium]|nr:SUMF1/EgtB/PvdO family nonheme iron enzyme [Bacteroidales bacterium]